MAQTGYTPLLIYSSSTVSQAPAAGNLTNSTLGSELAINITDGKLFYKDNANVVQVIAWKTTPTTAGGTGLTSYTAGDLLYYASGTTLTKLAIGTSGRWLGSSGTAPQWNAPAALTKTDDTNVTLTLGGSASTALLNAASLTLGWTGQLAVSRGGTGLSGLTANRILYASATDTVGTSSGFTFDGAGAFRSAGSTNGFLSSGTFVNSSNGTSAVNRIQIGNDSSDGAGQIVVYGSQHSTLSNIMDINNANTAALRFLTNNTERGRFTSGGDFLVATTTSSGVITAFKNASGRQTIYYAENASTAADAGARFRFKCGTQITDLYLNGSGNDKRFYIENNGSGVYLADGGTSWTNTSDERFKDIIEPITDAASKVSSLRAVIGKFKTDAEDKRRSFLIAQDILAVLPEAVDANNPEQLGVSYTDVIPLLVAAIKELTDRVSQLENKGA